MHCDISNHLLTVDHPLHNEERCLKVAKKNLVPRLIIGGISPRKAKTNAHLHLLDRGNNKVPYKTCARWCGDSFQFFGAWWLIVPYLITKIFTPITEKKQSYQYNRCMYQKAKPYLQPQAPMYLTRLRSFFRTDIIDKVIAWMKNQLLYTKIETHVTQQRCLAQTFSA